MRLRCAACGCFIGYTDWTHTVTATGELWIEVQPCKRCLSKASKPTKLGLMRAAAMGFLASGQVVKHFKGE